MMATPPSNLLSKIWLQWRALKLPWRKRWLAGTDLAGNTFWYFKPVSSAPTRRILQSSPRLQYADIQISPQWHQWLRNTRSDPPSLVEQQADLVRQSELRYLAQQADERWAAKPSVLDKPRRGNQDLAIGDGEAPGTVGVKGETAEDQDAPIERKPMKENPWKKYQGNPGDSWQPEAWTPGPKKR